MAIVSYLARWQFVMQKIKMKQHCTRSCRDAERKHILKGLCVSVPQCEPSAQFAESAKLEQAIKANLRGLGYGG